MGSGLPHPTITTKPTDKQGLLFSVLWKLIDEELFQKNKKKA